MACGLVISLVRFAAHLRPKATCCRYSLYTISKGGILKQISHQIYVRSVLLPYFLPVKCLDSSLNLNESLSHVAIRRAKRPRHANDHARD